MSNSEKIAQHLLDIRAVKLAPKDPFTWASGMRSPIYCDNRVTLSYPAIRNDLKLAFAGLARKYDDIDCIAGVATAGIAHGALLADALDLPYIYVRSSAKSHGRQNQIEGELKEGARLLVVEDLLSTGGSALKAVEALRATGAEVAAVFAVFTYGFDQAKTNFDEHNCTFETLTDYPTLLRQAKTMKYITEAEADTLSKWQADPKAWYAEHFTND